MVLSSEAFTYKPPGLRTLTVMKTKCTYYSSKGRIKKVLCTNLKRVFFSLIKAMIISQ